MGFGSYDESDEQRRQDAATDDETAEVDRHGEGHGGDSTFELEGSADDMLAQLEEIKADAEAEADE
jgi:hypothetical protein